ncbi:hypothetical protein IWW37_005227 [Coemansia sp. RSA 2050]|nr:hypothetical protein IWW37_005227 [Coemansia sp. RSA 2050]KAJ2730503.1 hypothetical protein IW152_005198 [Coemansia sp. BCRC 34962]
MPSLVPLRDEQAVAAAIDDSRQQAVATASTSNNEHAIRYVQQSVVASVAISDAAQSASGGFLHSFQGHVRMARLSARTNPEHSRGGKRHSGWLWRLLNM